MNTTPEPAEGNPPPLPYPDADPVEVADVPAPPIEPDRGVGAHAPFIERDRQDVEDDVADPAAPADPPADA